MEDEGWDLMRGICRMDERGRGMWNGMGMGMEAKEARNREKYTDRKREVSHRGKETRNRHHIVSYHIVSYRKS